MAIFLEFHSPSGNEKILNASGEKEQVSGEALSPRSPGLTWKAGGCKATGKSFRGGRTVMCPTWDRRPAGLFLSWVLPWGVSTEGVPL